MKVLCRIVAGVCSLALGFLFNASAYGQAEEASRADARIREVIRERSQAELDALRDPSIEDLVVLADLAISHLSGVKPPSLEQLTEQLDAKVSELLTSDIGRYLARQQSRVAAFLRIDESDMLVLNKRSLKARLERLQAARKSLAEYDSTNQGKFDSTESPAALSILDDAAWVESRYLELRDTLRSLELYEMEVPKDFDASGLPTMEDEKARTYASRFELIAEADLLGKTKAAADNADKVFDSVYFLESSRIAAEIDVNSRLAEADRKFLEAVFGRQDREYERKIKEEERKGLQEVLKTRETEAKMRLDAASSEAGILESASDAERERLIGYLQSARIKQLLAPFCTPGRYDASYHPGLPMKIEKLGNHPMSLSRMAECKCLAPTASDMSRLIGVANNNNDRPGWPVTTNTWDSAGDSFTSMDGSKVNPFIEAQRILREHGNLLVELGMLSN